jgi:WD40 repeat protein
LPHPASVIAVTWSPDGRLLASGDVEGSIRVWELQQSEPASCVHVSAAHTNLVDGLAFAPDGCSLASASWDGTVKLWDRSTFRPGAGQAALSAGVAGARPLRTLTGHTNRVRRVAWSPDGRILASCGFETTIWLWDIERSSYRAALQGHTAAVTGWRSALTAIP